MQQDVGPCLSPLARSRLSLVLATCGRSKGGSGRTLEVWEKPVRAFTSGVAGQSARDRKAFALLASHTPCSSPCCSAVRSATCTWQLGIEQWPYNPLKNAHALCPLSRHQAEQCAGLPLLGRCRTADVLLQTHRGKSILVNTLSTSSVGQLHSERKV
jgi:hypothetical protein